MAIAASLGALAQTPGDPTGADAPPHADAGPADDTLFVFVPARPLIESRVDELNHNDAYGFDVLFSNSGFGFGGFYQHNFSRWVAGFVNVGLTGSRNRDEFEEIVEDPSNPGHYLSRVPGKINRLYTVPLTVGIRYRLLDEVLVDDVRPYANIGVGPSMIVALPYDRAFFASFTEAELYVRAGGFVGVGVEVGGKRPIVGFNVRYYYIPFREGLESIEGHPMRDFGGLFLSANVGFIR